MGDLPVYRKELQKSRDTSQVLLDLLKKHTDDKGVIMISQTEVARNLKCFSKPH